ncbi:hypothetical protein Rmet_6698 (plasmid) [Cupriavidus metallidurans CH34]|uniref:Uncharacterized protein n=1 Tax=Cupriavidus metallidurans (strain ATCC 43123 / DSM 2839 / NBRC 102507 / CH34) TaxID=266264 RepID=D3DYB1_CUPMC|nr:hypothetical protein Rmet_6698 [Cupriavidus metallidurans CH34]
MPRGRSAHATDPALPQGARRAALPPTLAPQLAKLADHPPAANANWRYEVKFESASACAWEDRGAEPCHDKT